MRIRIKTTRSDLDFAFVLLMTACVAGIWLAVPIWLGVA